MAKYKRQPSSPTEGRRSLLERSMSDPSAFPEIRKVSAQQYTASMWMVATSFFRAKATRHKAWSMACGVLVLMMGFSVLNIWYLNMFRDFQNALHQKDADEFYGTMTKICVVALGTMPVSAFRDLLKGSLALEWRRYLTERLLARYIGDGQAYYRLKLEGSHVDNPDQRISQDTGAFTSAILNFVSTVLQAVITILSQSGILISIAPELFGLLLLYSVLLNVVSFCVFGIRLTELNRCVLAQEATMRFGLVRVRENAEPIAFYQGAPFERFRCGELFSELMSTLYRKLCVSVTFESLMGAQALLAGIMPYVVIAGKYLRGDLDFGAMSMAVAVLGGLQGAFDTLVKQMDVITCMGAQAARIQQIWEVLDTLAGASLDPSVDSDSNADPSASGGGGDLGDLLLQPVNSFGGASSGSIALRELPPDERGVLLHLEGVTLQPPRGKIPLVRSLTLELHNGESLLVCGPSGIGKSSLLRAIGGLWAGGSGTIERCAASHCFFVPQEPYLCLGSLRENATYPGSKQRSNGGAPSPGPSDAEIKLALNDVNIRYLAERFDLDDKVDLDSMLSGGERQRLGFVRLLLRPGLRFAIMDEATAALDEANENQVYHMLCSRVSSYISVGHRPNLRTFHTHRLLLDRTPHGGCSWSTAPLDADRPAAVGGNGDEEERLDKQGDVSLAPL